MHLTLNAEYDLYRWGPITQAPSLLDGDGGFPAPSRTCGTTPTSTRSAASCGPRWSGRSCGASTSPTSTRTWARSSSAPSSSTSTSTWRWSSACRCGCRGLDRADRRLPVPPLAEEEGVLFPDHFVLVRGGRQPALHRAAVGDLRPGVTEVYIHPAVDAPELRAFAPDWAAGSTTTSSSPPTPSWPSRSSGPASTASASASSATSNAPADPGTHLSARSRSPGDF